MIQKWNVLPCSAQEEALAGMLSQGLSVSPIVGQLLVRRGVRTIEQGERFLHPSLLNLHDPFLLKGMSRSVERIARALAQAEPLMIYGDYDVDGTSAVSLVYLVLREVLGYKGAVQYYVPIEGDEGYGVSHTAIDQLCDMGGGLMIVLDTGIKAHEDIDYAKAQGVDVLVCDHHQPGETLPEAYSIINPKQAGDTYPCKELSGCGVGYKLMQALLLHLGEDVRKLYNYLDLVAISIAADLVPLVDENRILLYYGLKQLASHPTMGLRALLSVCGLRRPLTIDSILYHIAPRINAAGRLMRATEAVALMTCSRLEDALVWAERLNGYNRERRGYDQELTEQAEARLLEQGDLPNRKVLVLYDPAWHRGVLGIVATRLSERYQKPTLLLTRSGDKVVGSGRSMRHIDLYSALEACQVQLINFGGHKSAVGLTIEEGAIDAFRESLEVYFASYVAEEALCQSLEADAELSIDQITPALARDLELLAPFGIGNEKPHFVTYRLRDAGGSGVVGKQEQHLRLKMTDRYCRYRPLRGIALGQAHHAPHILSQQSFAIYYTLEVQRVFDKELMQLQVLDLHT